MSKIYINNQFYEEAKAKISVKDRGFRFGDGCFETIAFANFKPYLLEQHLQRLSGGLNAIKIFFDVNILPQIIEEAISVNNIQNGFVRIMVTRGEGSRGYMPTYKSPPTLVIEVMENPAMKTTEARLCVSSYTKMSGVPTEYKLMQGLNSILAKIEATDAGFFEALLLDNSGNISEVSAGNIFFAKDDILYTPSLECGCLEGVMRGNIIELCNSTTNDDYNEKILIEQGCFDLKTLEQADEVFITNTAWKIMPVISIDGLAFEAKSSKYYEIIKDKILADIEQKCA